MAEAKTPAAHPRPLSPHLQVYRWSVTMASSILNRATGVAMGVGVLWLVWWLMAAATSAEAFAVVQDFSGSLIGRALLFGFTLALTFHMLNGIRHLFWDGGMGFGLKTAAVTGWLVFIGSVVLTGVIWVLGYMQMGAL